MTIPPQAENTKIKYFLSVFQGLGPTVEKLKSQLREAPTAKTKFTMVVPDVEQKLDSLKTSGIDTIVLTGIETHVCIVATCIDLIHRGFNVRLKYPFKS